MFAILWSFWNERKTHRSERGETWAGTECRATEGAGFAIAERHGRFCVCGGEPAGFGGFCVELGMGIFRVLGVLALVVLALLPAKAFADGKVFARVSAAALPIPDQQAIIVYDAAKGVQTLAIETRFVPGVPAAVANTAGGLSTSGTPNSSNTPAQGESAGGEPAPFAWVVPLPGPEAPKIRAATTGLFPTVRAVFQPRIETGASSDVTCMILPLVIIVGLLVCTTMLQPKERVIGTALVVLLIVLSVGVMLPSMGKARSSAGVPQSVVNVLERTTVGAYEVAVIGAESNERNGDPLAAGKELAAWLKANGFQMPEGVEPVLERYASRRWVFAACKLLEGAGTRGALSPHPLIFTFKTPECVYPLELTGVGNGPLTVDLYVFSDRRAAAPHFEEVRCEVLNASENAINMGLRWHHTGEIVIVHPLLKELVGSSTVATKLSATLTPEQQKSDAVLSWHVPRKSGGLKYSERGASAFAEGIAVATLVAGLIVAVGIGGVRKKSRGWVIWRMTWALVPAVIAGCGAYVWVPKIDVVTESGISVLKAHSWHESAAYAMVETLMEKAAEMPERPTVEDARRVVEAEWRSRPDDAKLLPIEEDSPLNYVVRDGEEPGSIEYVWFDAVGRPKVMGVWPGRE
jgi:hypothetical protein